VRNWSPENEVNVTRANEGNGMFMPKGEANKHKGRIAQGEMVLMIFVEKVYTELN